MSFTINGSSGITFPDATSQTTAATASIPAGAVTNFVNAAAPTGWTQVTTYNNYALRIVSGTGAGTGGSVGFTTVFASQSVAGTVGGYTLTTSNIPSHAHGIPIGSSGGGFSLTNGNAACWYSSASIANDVYSTNFNNFANGGRAVITATGGGGSHTHSFTGTAINLAVQYVDNILCTKN